MEKIKLAEDSIKHLKDFIEIEKVSKKVVTNVSTNELKQLLKNLVIKTENNIKEIKGE